MDPGRAETKNSFVLGLIADIQYADCEDGSDFSGEEQRYYRNSLEITRRAVDFWNRENVDAIVQLGDIIDGCNDKLENGSKALPAVLEVLGKATPRRFDLIGNHELYNIQRDSLPSSGLNCLGADGLTYYSAHLGDHWEAIFLDPYEVALIGHSEDSTGYKSGRDMMMTHNPNVLAATGDWFQGLPEEKHRYVPYNGGVSPEQLTWLQQTLEEATRQERKVLVFLHVPLYAPATKAKTVVWNAEDILRILHGQIETVVAVFAGHDHDGGYAVDPAGLHHVTMNSPLTASPGSECFALLHCHPEGLAHFQGQGRACTESNSRGKGRIYRELILAKGVLNEPEMMTAEEGDLAALVGMGFEQEQARTALQQRGSVEAAAELLLNQ
eukprot:TRINITY_DN29523_c0_g1_i1.p1 TRINITY_DN29523_c0_g1~~TRINITY_DN29523_c0_g1_i1.p1  ORF type:complete len:383 (+),score=63.40 TRINITY_DN29523_c0_g1_i1:134-1282(+)